MCFTPIEVQDPKQNKVLKTQDICKVVLQM